MKQRTECRKKNRKEWKKTVIKSVLALSIASAGCFVMQTAELSKAEAAREIVVWSDPNMEQAVRAGLERPEGDIYADELAEFTMLKIVHDYAYCWTGDIEDNWQCLCYEIGSTENRELSLEDLKWMPNLKILELSSWQVKDIEALENLDMLETLDMMNVGISDFSQIPALTSLRSLSLMNNNISDISFLSGLDNLTGLCLSDNKISDLQVLEHLSNLTDLGLADNEISDISALSGLSNLTSLELADNEISDVSALSGLSNLENLWLEGNEISDISALSGLNNLVSLDIRDNEISDFSALEGLEQIDILYLEDNPGAVEAPWVDETSEQETQNNDDETNSEQDTIQNNESEPGRKAVAWTEPVLENLILIGLGRSGGVVFLDELENIQGLSIIGDQVSCWFGDVDGEPSSSGSGDGSGINMGISLIDLQLMTNLKVLRIEDRTVFQSEVLKNLDYLETVYLEDAWS